MQWNSTTAVQLLVCCWLPLSVNAEPEIRVNSVYYMVTGNTAENIWADILATSPVQQNGRPYAAYTRWNASWRLWWRDDGDSCAISKVRTKLDVTYTLPRLTQTSSVPASVTAHWDKYYAALFEHELGHKHLGVEAANAIENQISGMGPRETCEQLEKDANNIGKSVIDQYSLLEKHYDHTTNHGLKTGAVFP